MRFKSFIDRMITLLRASVNQSHIYNNIEALIEADFIYKQIKKLITEIDPKFLDEDEVPEKLLHSLQNILKIHDQLTVNTDEEFLLNPYTPTNNLSWRSAETLLDANWGLRRISPYKIVMPLLEHTKSNITGNRLANLKYYQVIRTLGGASFTEIRIAFNYALNNNGLLATTSGAERVKLSPEERNLLINYSPETKAMNQGLNQALIKNSSAQYFAAVQKYDAAIAQGDYASRRTATYGEEGRKRLRERLIAIKEEIFPNGKEILAFIKTSVEKLEWNNFLKNFKINKTDLFSTREELFEFMAQNLQQKEWEDFLQDFDKIKFSKLLLNNSTDLPTKLDLQKGLASIEYKKGNSKEDMLYNKAISFCAKGAYWMIRDQNGEYNTIAAYLFRSLAAYNKTDKKHALEAYHDFLLSDQPLTHDSLYSFLTARPHDDAYPVEHIMKILLHGDLGNCVVKPALGLNIPNKDDASVAKGGMFAHKDVTPSVIQPVFSVSQEQAPTMKM